MPKITMPASKPPIDVEMQAKNKAPIPPADVDIKEENKASNPPADAEMKEAKKASEAPVDNSPAKVDIREENKASNPPADDETKTENKSSNPPANVDIKEENKDSNDPTDVDVKVENKASIPVADVGMKGEKNSDDPADVDMKENKGDPKNLEKQTLTLTAASALTSLSGHSPSPTENVAQEKCDEYADNDKSTVEDQGCTTKQGDDDDDIPMSFPQRLMEILSNEAHSEILTWLPHGKAFIIYQKKKFANEVLPRYFKQSKYTSFTRKLNRWGFIRVTRGPETGAYYHNCFQRGNLKLCMQMSCQSVKSPRNNRMQGIEWNALSGVAPTSSGPEIYDPPPAYPPETLQAMNLARKVHDNMLKLQQLAAAASLKNQMLLLRRQTSPGPASSDIAAMNPNSEYSVSVVKAAVDALHESKLSGSSMSVTDQFMSILNSSGNSGRTQQAAPKVTRRASAA